MFEDPAYTDELVLLVQQRGDEMSPSMKAFVATTRAWLIVLSGCGFVAAFALGVVVCIKVHKLFDGAAFVLPLIQTPVSMGAFLGLRRLRRRLAQKIALHLERELGAVSGSTSAAIPLALPRHAG
ncbi:MAG: hypothetical protein Q8O67_32215 [Deltaproteobacteria bacterium]|nr:hypothetical protein [Deltaproteobacteria bacterium]